MDEAFLDVTGSEQLFGSAAENGGKTKQAVREEIGLVVSVGVAPNTFLAKIASDIKKPDGFPVVEPRRAERQRRLVEQPAIPGCRPLRE
jgi:DNA polymerase IV